MSKLKLTVKHGKSTYEVTVDDSDLVSGVMQRIEQLTGVPMREQKLVCQGKVLPPTSSLQASKVKSGAKLMLLAGGSQTQVAGVVPAIHLCKHCCSATSMSTVHTVWTHPVCSAYICVGTMVALLTASDQGTCIVRSRA